METPEINLKLKTVYVEGKSIPLPTKKQLLKRVPRKFKKRLKKVLGEQGYIDWLNTPIKWERGEIKCLFNIDAEDELTKMLIKELSETQQ